MGDDAAYNEYVEMDRFALPDLSSGSVPPGAARASGDAKVLTAWLGSFWSEVYEDPGFISAMQEARGLRIAQLYLDLVENLALQDRSGAPVFHRERWHPVILRRGARDTGPSTMVRIGAPETVIGVQESDGTFWPPGTIMEIGSKRAVYKGMHIYPLDKASSGLVGIPACVCNAIVGATVVLGAGTGFALLDGAIAIAEDEDPFDGAHADAFPKFEVPPDGSDESGESDEETVLWACDALFDRDFVADHLGYAMGLPGKSSELYKRAVNAAWNAVASGGSAGPLRALLATMCGLPTVRHAGEVVETVLREADGVKVVTDREAYILPAGAELRKDVVPGAVLERFDVLDTSVRFYPCPNDMARLAASSEFLRDIADFREDVPSMEIPPAMLRTEVSEGFSLSWDPVEAVCAGFDRNGNPEIRFPLGGSQADADAFWRDVWKAYENAGRSMAADLFVGSGDDACAGITGCGKIFRAGEPCGLVSPMEFFLTNLVGANTLLATVRASRSGRLPLHDPEYFSVLRACVPSGVRLLVLEHCSPGSDTFGVASGDVADVYVYGSTADTVHSGRSGGRSETCSYDRVSVKWVASCGRGRV